MSIAVNWINIKTYPDALDLEINLEIVEVLGEPSSPFSVKMKKLWYTLLLNGVA